MIVTRDGRAVAELVPVAKEPLPVDHLLERWRRLPRVDPDRLCRQIDDVLDNSL